MTTLDLESIKERLDEATPGPWDFCALPQSVGITVATIHSEHGPRETCWTVDLPPEIGGMGTEKDAEFIAHAPEDIASLISEVERLRELIEPLRAIIDSHPNPLECGKHDDDDDPVSCGWKIAYTQVVQAIGGGEAA